MAMVTAVHVNAGQQVVLLTAGADGAVRLWEPETWTQVASLSGHLGPVNAAEFIWSAGGELVASQVTVTVNGSIELVRRR